MTELHTNPRAETILFRVEKQQHQQRHGSREILAGRLHVYFKLSINSRPKIEKLQIYQKRHVLNSPLMNLLDEILPRDGIGLVRARERETGNIYLMAAAIDNSRKFN